MKVSGTFWVFCCCCMHHHKKQMFWITLDTLILLWYTNLSSNKLVHKNIKTINRIEEFLKSIFYWLFRNYHHWVVRVYRVTSCTLAFRLPTRNTCATWELYQSITLSDIRSFELAALSSSTATSCDLGLRSITLAF